MSFLISSAFPHFASCSPDTPLDGCHTIQLQLNAYDGEDSKQLPCSFYMRSVSSALPTKSTRSEQRAVREGAGEVSKLAVLSGGHGSDETSEEIGTNLN